MLQVQPQALQVEVQVLRAQQRQTVLMLMD
jgi:hypothetical protein